MILVAFACNDPETGVFDGGLRALQIHGDHSAPEVELEGPSFPEAQDDFQWISWGFELAGRRFTRESWGNPLGPWELTYMEPAELLRLLTLLRELGWHCSAAASELFDAWKSGEPLTLELVRDALSFNAGLDSR